jgi:hypothetical protein
VKRSLLSILTILTFATLLAGGEGPSDEKRISRVQVLDQLTGEPIIGADVHVGSEVFYTDPDGFVELTLFPSSTIEIKVSYVSYQDQLIVLDQTQEVNSVTLVAHR